MNEREYSIDEQRNGDSAVTPPAQEGLRYDAGKLRFDLMPPDAEEEIIRVYTRGAMKYEDRNWERGMAWHKCLGPLKRHLNKWEKGAMMDEEYPELHHMAMVAWNAIALLTYELRQIGDNDVTLDALKKKGIPFPNMAVTPDFPEADGPVLLTEDEVNK
jgi:hypothetical protein